MKKLLILFIMFGLFFVPYVETQAYTIDSLDEPIAELNNLSLTQVFEGGNYNTDGEFNTSDGGLDKFLFNTTFLYESSNKLIKNIADIDGAFSDFMGFKITTNHALNDKIYFNQLFSNEGIANPVVDYIKYSFSTSGGVLGDDLITNPSQILTATAANNYIRLYYRDTNIKANEFISLDYFYAINLTSLGIDTLTQAKMDYYFQEYQNASNYIDGYNQGNLDGYAEGLEDNTAYVQGYNVGYTDGLTEGVDMETGSSIIVLVLAVMAFALMLFGFTSKRRIFNLFASGLFIALGGILFEYPAFIIVTVGLVIVNVYYTFVSD